MESTKSTLIHFEKGSDSETKIFKQDLEKIVDSFLKQGLPHCSIVVNTENSLINPNLDICSRLAIILVHAYLKVKACQTILIAIDGIEHNNVHPNSFFFEYGDCYPNSVGIDYLEAEQTIYYIYQEFKIRKMQPKSSLPLADILLTIKNFNKIRMKSVNPDKLTQMVNELIEQGRACGIGIIIYKTPILKNSKIPGVSLNLCSTLIMTDGFNTPWRLHWEVQDEPSKNCTIRQPLINPNPLFQDLDFRSLPCFDRSYRLLNESGSESITLLPAQQNIIKTQTLKRRLKLEETPEGFIYQLFRLYQG